MTTDPHTVLVTGANGFLGARTCAALAVAGHPVRAQVRRAGTAPIAPGVTEVVADLDGLGPATLADVDVVVHTAAAAGADLAAVRAVNVAGTRAVVAAAAAAGVGRVVHVSTTSVYAQEGDAVIDEESALVTDGPTDDVAPYALTKAEGEAVAREAAGDAVELVVLRPPGILGWGPTSTWGQRVPAGMVAGEPLMVLPAAGTQGWVHVDDLVDVLVLVVTHPDAAGLVANVVGGCWTWADYDAAVRERFPEAVSGVDAADEGWTGRYAADRLARVLGITPTRTAASALDESAAHADAVRRG